MSHCKITGSQFSVTSNLPDDNFPWCQIYLIFRDVKIKTPQGQFSLTSNLPDINFPWQQPSKPREINYPRCQNYLTLNPPEVHSFSPTSNLLKLKESRRGELKLPRKLSFQNWSQGKPTPGNTDFRKNLRQQALISGTIDLRENVLEGRCILYTFGFQGTSTSGKKGRQGNYVRGMYDIDVRDNWSQGNLISGKMEARENWRQGNWRQGNLTSGKIDIRKNWFHRNWSQGQLISIKWITWRQGKTISGKVDVRENWSQENWRQEKLISSKNWS